MASVLLIRPLCEGDEPEFAEPLGIERLAGYLRAHGVRDVHVFDRRLEVQERRAGLDEVSASVARGAVEGPGAVGGHGAPEAPGFFERLRECYAETEGPTIVGLSLMTSADVPDARRVISRLGAWWPQALFVAGGIYVTTAPEAAARKLPKHVVFLRGEGEVQLLDLVRDCAGQPDGFGCQPSCPDEWAIPYRPHLERYARLRCAASVQASRGCHGACTFCATPSLPRELRRWSPRDVELVLDEVEGIAKRLESAHLPTILNFVDDDFGSLERLESFAAGLKRRDLRIAFACEMRLAELVGQAVGAPLAGQAVGAWLAGRADDASLAHRPSLAERLARLRDAGLTRVFFGLESLDAAVLARWRKPIDLAALPGVLASFREAGVSVQVGYILWHGTQTLGGALQEVEHLRALGIYSHRAALSRLIVFPGCELAESDVPLRADGFEPLGDEAAEFYRRFCVAAADLTEKWTRLAIDEPYATAEAFLSGDEAPARSVRARLDEINERSYRLFKEMCS